MRIRMYLFLLIAVWVPVTVFAETEIVVDGDSSDWASSDAQCADTQYNSQGSDYADVVNICVADSASTDGYFYVLLEFAAERTDRWVNNVWLRNANVLLYVDANGDGDTTDPGETIDFLNAPEDEVWGWIDLPYLEVRVDYDLVDPDGDGDFQFYFDTFWGATSNNDDRVPIYEDSLLTYSKDPATGSPRAVRMLAQQAKVKDRGVNVTWVTASERANAGFHVFRKSDRGAWTQLTTTPIAGLGDAAFGQKYEYFDAQGLPGDVYTVQDLEFSGKKRFNGPIVAVDESSLIDSFIPKMLAKFNRPYDFESRIRKLFANANYNVGKQTSSASMKYLVDVSGLHYIPNHLLADAQLRRRRVSLSTDGKKLPSIKDRNGIYFLGTPLKDRYADYSVVVANEGQRTQMFGQRVKNNCRTYQRASQRTVVLEKDTRYYIGSPTADPFYWATAYSGMPAVLAFELPGIINGEATLKVSLVGFAASQSGVDHEATFTVNGNAVGRWQWEGKGEAIATVTIPAGVLIENNTLEIALIDNGVPDMLSIDNIEATYNQRLALQEGQLRFEAVSGTCVAIDGVTEAAFVFDVTEPAQPVLLRGAKNNGGVLRFKTSPNRRDKKGDHLSGPAVRQYLVAQKSAAQVPVEDAPLTKSPWAANESGAEYVIITHPLFEGAARKLADYYSAFMSVATLTTTQLYDEYTGGRPHPDAIKQFLNDAQTVRQSAPQYVLLMGGATVDSNDVLDTGDEDFVPTYYYRTHLMGYEAASDASFTKGMPNIMLGRLAMRSAEEANVVVDKLLDWYYQESSSAGLSVYVADQDSSGGAADEAGAFEQAVEAQLHMCDECATTAERFFLNDISSPTAALNDLLLQGIDFLNFHGHAYISGWSSPQIANLAFADALQNEHLFFVMSWSCFDGMFSSPWDDALSWQFVANPTAGAYGALAASSLSDPAYVEMLSQLVTAELAGGAQTMGEALNSARLQLSSHLSKGALDTIFTYNLLADPAAPNPWLNK